MKEPTVWEYEREDFMTTKPYEELYQFHVQPFVHATQMESLAAYAASKGFRGFKSMYKKYVESLKAQSGTLYIENVTQFTNQPLELNADKIEVEGACPPEYPLQKKRHTVEYLREQAYLRPRTNLFSAVFRVRSEVAYAIHSFFHETGHICQRYLLTDEIFATVGTNLTGNLQHNKNNHNCQNCKQRT